VDFLHTLVAADHDGNSPISGGSGHCFPRKIGASLAHLLLHLQQFRHEPPAKGSRRFPFAFTFFQR
jgi:hypothetical protein